jgi:hypothetical protein
MQVAVRPYLTTGIAIVGASVIAVTPIAATSAESPLSQAHVSTANVKLTASVDPITAYVQLISTTLGNLSAQAGDFLSNPAPILTQIFANQVANSTALAGALGDFGSQFASNVLSMVPADFQQAIGNILAGNIVGAGQNVVDALVQPALLPALGLLPALQTFLSAPVANMLAVSQQFVTIGALTGLGVLSPLVSTINSNAQALQNLVDAVTAGDPIGAVGAIAAAPAIVLNGIINGFGADGGLINPGLSLVSALRNILTTIATAITPAAATSVAAVASPMTKAAATVTLDVTPPAAVDTGSTAKDSTGAAVSGKDSSDSAISTSAAKGSDAAAGVDTDKAAESAGKSTDTTDIDAGKDAETGADAGAAAGSTTDTTVTGSTGDTSTARTTDTTGTDTSSSSGADQSDSAKSDSAKSANAKSDSAKSDSDK